jgi:predicted solute-binding protein
LFVSWWETSPETGSSESVLRVSMHGGQTFGPMIMLGTNVTITTTTAAATGNTTTATTTTAATGGETVEEEAVGGTDVAE